MVGMMGMVCSTAGRCRNRDQIKSRGEANTVLEASKRDYMASTCLSSVPLEPSELKPGEWAAVSKRAVGRALSYATSEHYLLLPA